MYGPAATITLNASGVIWRSEGGVELGGSVPGITVRTRIVWPWRFTPHTPTICPGKRAYSIHSLRSRRTRHAFDNRREPSRKTDCGFSFPSPSQQIRPTKVADSGPALKTLATGGVERLTFGLSAPTDGAREVSSVGETSSRDDGASPGAEETACCSRGRAAERI